MEQMEKKLKVKIAAPLKHWSNFCRSLKMSLINCKVELSLTWIGNCVLSGGENINNAGAVENARRGAIFTITDAKLYVPVVTVIKRRQWQIIKTIAWRI